MSTFENHHPSALATALFGKTRQAVLALLFGHPDESFYVREIVRLVDAGHGAVQRELRQLAACGIIRRSVQGRQVYYQANAESPVFELSSPQAPEARAASRRRAKSDSPQAPGGRAQRAGGERSQTARRSRGGL